MESPPETPQPSTDDLVEQVRDRLDRVEKADDETRLETVEGIRRDLEAELDSSLENGTSGH